MNLSLILIIFFLISYRVIGDSQEDKKKIKFIVSCIVPMMLFSALRSLDYGSLGQDTPIYYQKFKDIVDTSYLEIFQMILPRYVYGTADVEYDIGYMLLQKIISYITTDFHLFTFIAQLLFYIPFGLFLKKYSSSTREILFAFIFYLALGYGFSNTGARQLYAMGMGFLFFMQFNEKKYIKAAVSLFIALSMHLSVLLIVLPILANQLSESKLKQLHLLAFLIFPVVMMFPNEIIRFMGSLVATERYTGYGADRINGGALTFITLLELLSIICLISIKKENLEENKLVKALYSTAPFFTFFGPLIYSNGTMIRLAMYSFIYLTLLFPNALRCGFKNQYNTVLIASMLVLSFYCIFGAFSYNFFWEVDPVITW